MPDLTSLEQSAYRIRRYALRMGEVQGQGLAIGVGSWQLALKHKKNPAFVYNSTRPHPSPPA